MAKRRFRIEGGRYGGELVLGEANPEFIKHYQDLDEGELIDVLLEEDSQGWTSDDEPEDALLNPETPPSPVADPGYGYNMWECDDVEHLNSAYADGGFYVYEIPADGTDDWDYEKVVYEGDGMLLTAFHLLHTLLFHSPNHLYHLLEFRKHKIRHLHKHYLDVLHHHIPTCYIHNQDLLQVKEEFQDLIMHLLVRHQMSNLVNLLPIRHL